MAIFIWAAPCLVQINSCVNPFIYAAILPEYKKLAREKLSIKKRLRRGSNKSPIPYTNTRRKLVEDGANQGVTEMAEVVHTDTI